MSATNYPEFNAAVTELTTQVETLITRVRQTETQVNIALSEAAATTATAAADAASAAASEVACQAVKGGFLTLAYLRIAGQVFGNHRRRRCNTRSLEQYAQVYG